MPTIRIFSVTSCIEGDVRKLYIDGRFVGEAPLTYTTQECAEIYCELEGWELLNFRGLPSYLEKYSMRVKIPS